jgi:hypothetical protein
LFGVVYYYFYFDGGVRMTDEQFERSYKIICDETNNTLEDAENGVVNVDIIITHHKTIDKLPLNL